MGNIQFTLQRTRNVHIRSVSAIRRHAEHGSVMVAILILSMVFTTVGLSLAGYTLSQYMLTARKMYTANALMTAEAGIERSLHALNQDDLFDGYSTEQILYDDETQGRGVYVTTVEDAEDTNAKIITSTGTAYRPTNLSDPVNTRTVRVTVVGTESDGFSVFSGPGGLLMSGSAHITNSDIYINGTVSLSGRAQIGTETQPVELNVAHVACPTGSNPGPSFPEVCDSGSGEPISLQQSTDIYGTVCATNQTSTGPNNNIKPGDGGEGLLPGCVAPQVSQPSYDREAHIDAVVTEASASNNTYTCQQWPFDRTWPDGLQLTGNVSITGSCDVTIHGDVYITGDLTLGGAASIRVADELGEDRPVVLVDGKIDIGGSGALVTNDSGTGIHFISFMSNAPCNPGCTNITGTELKNTQDLLTVDVGGNVNLAGMIFQAYWGRVKVAGSGNIGAATGQTVDLRGSGTVTFGTNLSTGSRTWTVTSYQQLFGQ